MIKFIGTTLIKLFQDNDKAVSKHLLGVTRESLHTLYNEVKDAIERNIQMLDNFSDFLIRVFLENFLHLLVDSFEV